jgi:hypothetical protein
MDGDAELDVNRTVGVVTAGFGNDWAYDGNVNFADFAHVRGSTRFDIEGDYTLASQYFAKTGVQTIDFDSIALDAYYNGFLLEVTELCHESNAFGASQQQSESFSFRLRAGPLGELVVNSLEPFGGDFGGPPSFGRMEISGGADSGVTIDATRCGLLAVEVTGRGPGGTTVTPEPNCVPLASFQD